MDMLGIACGMWRVSVLDMEAFGKGSFPVLLSSKNLLGKCFLFHLIIIERFQTTSPAPPSPRLCVPQSRCSWRTGSVVSPTGSGRAAVQGTIGHFRV